MNKIKGMLRSSTISKEELERRESYLRENTRPFVLLDPSTWPRRWITAGGGVASGLLAWKYYADWSRRPVFYGMILGFLR